MIDTPAPCSTTLVAPCQADYERLRLSDIAGGVFPHDAVHRLVIVFRLYLDESKRDGVFAVGGYLGHLDQWDRFEDQWGRVLRQAGVQAFHATDFYNRRGEFKGWDVKKTNKFAKLFTAVAEAQTEVAVGRAVDETAYMEILAPVSQTSTGPLTESSRPLCGVRAPVWKGSLLITGNRFPGGEPR
jgi:hypothetical protein